VDSAAAGRQRARAMGLALLGNKLPAEQAAAWGNDMAIASTTPSWRVQSMRWARQFARGADAGPLAATKGRHCGAAGGTHSRKQLDIERDTQRDLGRSSDYAEGVAAFTEKRAAELYRPLT